MITIIFAPPRTGKTAFMTSRALQRMRGIQARQDIKSCKRVLEPLNNNGFNLSLPKSMRHLVFSDYPIFGNRRGTGSYEVNGYYLGMPNKQHKTVFLPPCAQIYLDEGQKYYDSRKSMYLSDFVSRFYELHGHYKMNVMITVQRPGLIDLNIRELSQQVIEIDYMEHKYVHGLLVKTTWYCHEFDNVAAAIKYIDGGKKKENAGDKTEYVYNGNVFKYYDCENWFPAFFKMREERKRFDIIRAKPRENTLDGVREFNEKYDYEVPETYLKRGIRQ